MTWSIKVSKFCFFIGNRILSRSLSCDSVMDGAFFPQPDFQVPEEKVCQHAREYVVMPAFVFAELIMIHAKLGFGFLEALFDRPAQSAEPYKSFEPDAGRRIADVVAVLRIFANRSTDQQPYGFLRKPGGRQDHPPSGELIDDRPLSAL